MDAFHWLGLYVLVGWGTVVFVWTSYPESEWTVGTWLLLWAFWPCHWTGSVVVACARLLQRKAPSRMRLRNERARATAARVAARRAQEQNLQLEAMTTAEWKEALEEMEGRR